MMRSHHLMSRTSDAGSPFFHGVRSSETGKSPLGGIGPWTFSGAWCLGFGIPPRSPLQLFFQVMDDLADVRVNFHPVFHQATGVQNGAVVASAKRLANGVERAFGELPRQEHGDLPGKRDVF